MVYFMFYFKISWMHVSYTLDMAGENVQSDLKCRDYYSLFYSTYIIYKSADIFNQGLLNDVVYPISRVATLSSLFSKF